MQLRFLESLEARVMMSVAPVLGAFGSKLQATVIEPMRRTRVGAGPTLSLADRQELLNNWIGPNKATLSAQW
jgi:hypothetical protein